MFAVQINDGEPMNVEADSHTTATDKAAQCLGVKDHYRLLDQEWVVSITSERLMIYATIFNNKTKQAIGPSTPMGVHSMAEAEALLTDKPVERTKNTLIYKQVGDSRLCVSWIRFSK